MQNIETLMRELNLGDDVINNTLMKIDYICSKYDSYSDYSPKVLKGLCGNGDGNN